LKAPRVTEYQVAATVISSRNSTPPVLPLLVSRWTIAARPCGA
jgi:hypothetical protein